MKQYYTTNEIAELFGVTKHAVGLWVKNGLNYELERVIKRKPRRVFRYEEVERFLKLGVRVRQKGD